MTGMIRKQIYITPQQDEALKRLAEATGRSQADIIRAALDRWFKEQQQKRREAELELESVANG
jgi:hypothetical protein